MQPIARGDIGRLSRRHGDRGARFTPITMSSGPGSICLSAGETRIVWPAPDTGVLTGCTNAEAEHPSKLVLATRGLSWHHRRGSWTGEHLALSVSGGHVRRRSVHWRLRDRVRFHCNAPAGRRIHDRTLLSPRTTGRRWGHGGRYR